MTCYHSLTRFDTESGYWLARSCWPVLGDENSPLDTHHIVRGFFSSFNYLTLYWGTPTTHFSQHYRFHICYYHHRTCSLDPSCRTTVNRITWMSMFNNTEFPKLRYVSCSRCIGHCPFCHHEGLYAEEETNPGRIKTLARLFLSKGLKEAISLCRLVRNE
jgi:hypothetical protein